MFFFFLLIFFIKAYVFGTVELLRQGTQNIFLYKQVDRKYTGCNLKTMELLDCGLIEVYAVIRSNTVCCGYSLEAPVVEGGGGFISFVYSLSLLFLFLPCSSSLSSLLLSLLSPFSLSLGDDTK